MISSILIQYKYFSNRFIRSIDGTLTNTTTPAQIGPGCNGNEGATTHFPELEPYNQTQFSVTPKITPF